MDLISLSSFPATYIKRVNLQPEDLDEDILMDFAMDSVQRLQSEKTCKHVVALLPAYNFNAPKPKDMYKVVEIAYKNEDWKHFHKYRPMYVDQVVSWTDKNFAGCDVKITVECDKCHQHICECGDNNVLIKVDDDWLDANVERQYWHNPRYIGAYGLNKAGGTSCFYHPEFSLMRPASHRFFGANYHVRGCINLDRRLLGDYPVEYKIEGNKIRINVETGTILLAYMAVQRDDDGFPLAPDDPDVFEAIFWDVESKMLYRKKDKAKNNYSYFERAKQYADFHMRRAKNKIDAITPQEWSMILRNHFKKLQPKNTDMMAGRVQADKYDGAINRRRNG